MMTRSIVCRPGLSASFGLLFGLLVALPLFAGCPSDPAPVGGDDILDADGGNDSETALADAELSDAEPNDTDLGETGPTDTDLEIREDTAADPDSDTDADVVLGQCPVKSTMPAGPGDTVGNLTLPVVRQGQPKEFHSLYDLCVDPGELRYLWIIRATTVCKTCVQNYETLNETFAPEYGDRVAIWFIIENPTSGGNAEACFPNTPTGWENARHAQANFPILHDCEGAETSQYLEDVSSQTGRAFHYIIDVPSMTIISTTDDEDAEINDIIPFFVSQLNR